MSAKHVPLLSHLANILRENMGDHISLTRWQNKYCWQLDILTIGILLVFTTSILPLIFLFSTLFYEVSHIYLQYKDERQLLNIRKTVYGSKYIWKQIFS